MSTDRSSHKLGWLNLLVFLGLGVAAALAARYARTATGEVTALLLGFGLLVSLVAYLQLRLEAQEQLEKLEFDELQKAKNAAALFDQAEAENFPARRSRLQFERFGVPLFAAVLLLLQGAAVYWMWRRLPELAPVNLDRALIGTAMFGLFALIQFLLGKYAAGVARMEKQRLFRPGASHLLMGSLANALTVAALTIAFFGNPKVDLFCARFLLVVVGLSTVELLFNVLFEAYRPRLKGQTAHLLYDSRVIGLVGDPAGFFTTAAHALDYQFGFKVSETWFFQFLQRAIAWILLLQLGVLWLSTTLVFIEPGEQALLERFGKPSGRGVLDPGAHLKLPWPVEKVYRFQTRAMQSFLVGVVPDEKLGKERTVLWTKAHYKEEFNMLVASRQQQASTNSTADASAEQVPVNLLTASIPVQYVIGDLEKWAYRHANAGELLERLATREVVSFLASVDIDEIMSSGRIQAANVLRQRIQKAADAQNVGARIVFVGLQDIHPPVTVAESYEAVNAALQARAGITYTAEGDKAQAVPMAKAQAANILSEAQVYRLSEEARAAAAAGRFPNQVLAMQAAPEVFRQRAYLETLSRALQPARKYVLGTTNTEEIILMNLEDKVRLDLVDDVALPKEEPKK